MDRDRFTYRDVTQTLRAFKAAGVPIARVEIYRDGVIVFPGEPTDDDTGPDADKRRETLEHFRNAVGKKTRGRPQ
jgi:radical SAM superfamily enzyme with C-terminal helix-hairpin-helix motif